MTVKDSIVSMFRSGMSQSAIRKQLGVHKSYVSNTLRDSGDRPTAWELPEPIVNIIRTKYTQGASRNEIVAELRVTEHQARMALRGFTRTHGDTNHLKAVRNAPDVSDFQRQMVLGSLLGDASITQGECQGYRVQISHSEKQAGYIQHIAGMLNVRAHPYKNPGFSKLPLWKLTYQNVRFLEEVANIVLVNDKKTVNVTWLNQLDIRAVAYWFMDDGSSQRQKSGVSVSFHTQGFSVAENEILASWLTSMGFLTKLNKCKTGTGVFLSMSHASTQSFMQQVAPYVQPIECMRYKCKFQLNEK